MQTPDSIETTLRTVVHSICRHHEDVEIFFRPGEQLTSVFIRVNNADKGRLIGQQRRMFMALGQLVMLMGRKADCELSLARYLDSTKGEREMQVPFTAAKNWDGTILQNDMDAVLEATVMGTFKAERREDDERADTTFTVSHDDTTLPLTLPEFCFMLSTIFHAIGKARGRNVYVNPKR